MNQPTLTEQTVSMIVPSTGLIQLVPTGSDPHDYRAMIDPDRVLTENGGGLAVIQFPDISTFDSIVSLFHPDFEMNTRASSILHTLTTLHVVFYGPVVLTGMSTTTAFDLLEVL